MSSVLKWYYGVDLLICFVSISSPQLTEQEHALFRSGFYQLIPAHDRAGRGVAYSRMCQFHVANKNYKSLTRYLWYVESAIEDDPDMQRKGVVTVVDCGGKWKSSPFEYLHFFASYPQDAVPFHDASLHILYNEPTIDIFIRKARLLLRKDYRLRVRLHLGSMMENEYELKTFGITVSGQLGLNDSTGPLFPDSIEEEIRQRQKRDDEWRRSEARYREPNSQIALFPNPQDIVMGRNKLVAGSWPGNIIYHKVIGQHVQRYIEAHASDRIVKTLIAVEVLQLLHSTYCARFLARSETQWEVIDDSEAQKKISQALRMMAREVVLQKGALATCSSPVSSSDFDMF